MRRSKLHDRDAQRKRPSRTTLRVRKRFRMLRGLVAKKRLEHSALCPGQQVELNDAGGVPAKVAVAHPSRPNAEIDQTLRSLACSKKVRIGLGVAPLEAFEVFTTRCVR